MFLIQFFKHFDWRLFIPIILLVSVGIVVIYSATWGETGENFAKVRVQLVAGGIGLIFLLGLSSLDYRILRNYYFLLYFIMIAILTAVLFWGSTIRGSKSWFSFGWFQFQPSELAKIIFIITLASFLAKYQEHINKLRVWIASGILTLVPVGLIVLEHDLGAVLILLLIWLGMLVGAGLKLRYIMTILLLLILGSLLAWFLILAPYQKSRLLSFVNPQRDPLGRSYNLIQSIIAVGSGGLWGKGLGYGSQSQLKFLPEQHTDFIFAVTAEEFGFLGGVIVLVLFSLLILRILKIGYLALDKFGALLASGVAVLILVQVIINIGMNIGLSPVIGISLPLISYGGSALVSFLIGLGIVESIYVNYHKALFRRKQ